ncbi:STP1 protein [Plasmodium ovale curtisi]|nr:STP1 protein [Plasmodium ovale curtisi]
MADHLEYTTLTHYIPIEVFYAMIESDIKKLIHTHGHKNCGLMHEELCEKIKKIIYEKKNTVLNLMDKRGKNKWDSEWRRQRNEFFNRLFEKEGFINVCYPLKEKGNTNLQKLKSRHIQFCKEKDVKHAAVVANPVYSDCVKYNSWIDTQRISFTREYLSNVSNFNSKTVNKSFSTKEHPGGHDPLRTYRKSKLDCEIYNPKSNRYQKELVEKALTNKAQPPRAPNIRQGSQGKDEKSVTVGDSASEKTKPNVKKPLQIEISTPKSQISSQPNTQPDGIPTAQDTPVKPKDPVSSVNVEGEKKESTTIHHQPPTGMPPTIKVEASPKDSALSPVIRHQPSPTGTTPLSSTLVIDKNTTASQTPATSSTLTMTSSSSLNLGLPSPSDPLPNAVVTKDQDKPFHSTTTPVTSTNTHSTQILPATSAAVPSLAQPQTPTINTPPVVTSAQGFTTPSSSSSSTVTATVTTTSTAPASVTTSTMSTKAEPISSVKEATNASSSQEPPPPPAAVGPEATASATDRDPQKTVILAPMSLSGSDTAIISVQTKPDIGAGTKLATAVLSKTKVTTQAADDPLSKDAQQASGYPSGTHTRIPDSTLQNIPHHTNQQFKPTVIQNPPRKVVISSASNKSDASVNTSKDDSTVRNNKNDKPNIIPESIPPLMDIIPTILVILATLTLLFQLYKYTPFGFLLGRRRKRKKQDLRKIFEIPEKPAYESPNITVHELEDPNLVGQTVKKDAYIKLLKINRYKQEMQKRKKKKKTTLIEVHMEIFEEYKKDEWELHKGDFLEICLRGFINEENETYQNFANLELIVNNIKNEKTIEDIQKQQHLWNNLIENHRNILEEWKKDEWFLILKNEWRKEKNIYQEKNHNLKENVLNEPETHSIVSQKDIWKQWIPKQATLIKTFNEEDWFKALVDEQNKEKDNYGVKYNDNAIVTNINGSENENSCNKPYERKKIIEKLMVQIHMMVLEECIKEDIMRNKEISIDNYIKSINNKNNYEQKSYIPECASDGFNVSEFKEINTYVNK